MFIELVESLRCVREHGPTWLVATIEDMHGRDIIEGVLGCPLCKSEYPIVGGVADFSQGGAGTGHGEDTAQSYSADEGALRIAALLDILEPGGLVILAGSWTRHARSLVRLTENAVHVVALNPRPSLEGGAGTSILCSDQTIPLRSGVARGIALDDAHVSDIYFQSAVSALRSGGRLVAPASSILPSSVRLLARDERFWLAGKEEDSGPILQIGRR